MERNEEVGLLAPHCRSQEEFKLHVTLNSTICLTVNGFQEKSSVTVTSSKPEHCKRNLHFFCCESRKIANAALRNYGKF
ncbi:hypothetical protein CHS0354_030694 [Potamilus streckersoni]|uniref:Uncharacterized protein n=1 Tax=Potamilus streckersoni TaxID=2493646 RepID=A0AAE0VQG1_9BIVA|nr:hypothetical protein CHS0354_030694 [Potamilus streckersoni]